MALIELLSLLLLLVSWKSPDWLLMLSISSQHFEAYGNKDDKRLKVGFRLSTGSKIPGVTEVS